MKWSKKLNRNGGLTIPKAVRAELGVFSGDGVDIEVIGDKLVLSRHVNTCRFCGSPDNIKTVMGIYYCGDCAVKLSNGMAEVAICQ